MSLLFNMLFRLVITFFQRSERLLITWLQSPSAVILESPKRKYDTVSTVSPSICHEVICLYILGRHIYGGQRPGSWFAWNYPHLCAPWKVSMSVIGTQCPDLKTIKPLLFNSWHLVPTVCQVHRLYKVATILNPTLQIMKLMHREVIWLVQSVTSSKWATRR